MTQSTDPEIAKILRDACEVLNRALCDASKAGLHVELSTIRVHRIHPLGHEYAFDHYGAIIERRTTIQPIPENPT
jgi:hypothetical protein